MWTAESLNLNNIADYIREARSIEARWKAEGAGVLRFAVLGSFTADFVRPFLITRSDELGLPLRPWFAPFGQFEQMVLDAGSPLWAEPVDACWFALRIEDADPTLVNELPELAPPTRVQRVRRVRQRLVDLVRAARERTTGVILASNFASPPTLDAFDANDPDGLVHVVAAENRALAQDLISIPGAHVFDWSGLQASVGLRTWEDAKLTYMARAPLAGAGQAIVGCHLVRCLRALLRPAAKCLVVDLDNTLWGGVIGDDGPEGIKLGDEHPGNVFKDFQRALLQLRRRGFLLAVASKNDPQTVDGVLRTHPEMVLRPRDFAAIVANWEPKPDNIRRIAEELNLGLDTLVFLDDNPVERAQVRALLPSVTVPELSADPIGFIPALRELVSLDRPRLLAEDRARAAMYEADGSRQELARSAPDLSTFLADLNMNALVGRCTPREIDRVHQLIQKTNQFNLTSRRYGIDEITRLAKSPEAAVAWLRLDDRFGDMGLCCVGIVRQMETALWEIDTFLMSCRVMGRQVEDAFLAYLCETVAGRGAHRMRGVFRRTSRNKPVEDFFPVHGFQPMPAAAAGEGDLVYERDLVAQPISWPSVITRSSEGSG
jgi:FkbH-like protein